ncbi:MAG: preprotein translocase subunit SecE [Actinobacteria bacterium]|nr:preprotein translocase subunit SecE [Actinomycetota bacterium]
MAWSPIPKSSAKAPAKAPAKASAKTLPAKGAKSSAQVAARAGGGRSARRFLREVRNEMAKVTWPPRQELVQATMVVLVAIAIAATYIGLLDLVWSTLVKLARLG